MRLVLALALAACSGKAVATRPPPQLLFDRLGGMDGIKGLMQDFVEDQLSKDSRVNVRFTTVNKSLLTESLAVQLCELTGGPCKYSGRRMKEAHAGMAITDADFIAFREDLEKSLAKFKVADREQRELLAIIAKLRDQIVE